VIPHIERVIKPASDGHLPTDTPYEWCGNTDICVTGTSNAGKELAILINFFKNMSIAGFGPSLIATIYNNGYRTPSLVIKMTKQQFLDIPGFSNKEALYSKMSQILDSSDCIAYMNALNVFGSGFGVKKITSILDSLTYDRLQDITYESLLNVPGVSDITARKFLKGISTFVDMNIRLKVPCDKINGNNNEPSPPSKANKGRVVFSGFRDSELEKRLKACGYDTSTSLSKSIAYLIVSSSKNTSKKVKADELKIPIISRDQAIDMLC
jgi:NAD-dependent DNA ligase